jgi:hypothetical protein
VVPAAIVEIEPLCPDFLPVCWVFGWVMFHAAGGLIHVVYPCYRFRDRFAGTTTRSCAAFEGDLAQSQIQLLPVPIRT